ncbi:hypothetical protein H1D32_15590 [Anaerobacillus sp. CMMVII]|uniref:hypothetical protein n=1 Tax=Anaerobacillus sp. CMMVII TaxID=2755588 RepID=UPI0021B70A17|nr:hypothetical protein [Anaerobacillus sp. CMMVII]MCT8139008.1 hypothetical protein [Anaerobacillus sp. CMMVII]
MFKKMKDLDRFPKSIKKAVRYIKQEASKDELDEIKKLIEYAIERRTFTLK